MVLVALVPIDFAGCCPSVCVPRPYPRTWLDSFGDARSARNLCGTVYGWLAVGRRTLRSGGGLQLTSGTTGHPKAWVKTYRSWQAVIDHNLHHFDTSGPGVPPVGPDDVNLHFHPIQWASGFQTLYPYYVRGARTVLLDDEVFHPGVLLDTIASEQVTGVFMLGPLLTPVLDEIEARDGFTHRLRRMVVFFGNPDQLDLTTRLLARLGARVRFHRAGSHYHPPAAL